MKKIIGIILATVLFFVVSMFAISTSEESIRTPSEVLVTEESSQSAVAQPSPRPDITQKSKETLGPLEKLLEEQKLGSVYANPLKYAIRGAVAAGVPANTIVLLLLIPLVALIIASARHLIGIRGFGIFLPAALAVTFVATGPVVGIGLFLVIVFVSVLARFILRKSKLKLQYLPKAAILLWFVVLGVLGVLFAAPVIKNPDLSNVSIFPVLILALLAEDFSRVQMGKSAKTAISLTTETLILALVSYIVLILKSVQSYVLLNPEITLTFVAIFDLILGRYVGLRFMEFWKFRKLIKS